MPSRPSSATPAAGPGARRRLLGQAGAGLLAAWALPLLTACGGGGGDGGGGDGGGAGGDSGGGVGTGVADPAAPAPAQPPTGLLAYRNGSMAALHDFTAGADAAFAPGDGPLNRIGVSATPDGRLVTALEGDNSRVLFATFDRQGKPQGTLQMQRPFAFATGLPVFNAAGSRAAIGLNELATPEGMARIDRVLLVTWPASFELARFDGWTSPVWAGDQLILRHAETGRLRLFGTDLRALGDIGPADGIASNERLTVGPDPRHLVYSRDNQIRCFDRQTLADTVVARREIARLSDPCLSPDGRWLAVHTVDSHAGTLDFSTTVPHILPFDPAGAVLVDSARHALPAPAIVECGGQMVWLR